MANRKVCYELYIGGRIAARGDAALIASTLGLSEGTVQRSNCRGHSIPGVEVARLPILYDFDGDSLTAAELAERHGVSCQTVVSAACGTGRMLGKPLRKHEYEEFSVGMERALEWREDVRRQW